MSEETLTTVDCTEVISTQEPIIQLTENGVEGFEILCRLCANRSDHLIPIYSEEGISNDLADKMNLYLPIKVSKTDLLPLQCCFQCATTVLTWHELVIASVEADRRLREVQSEVEKQIAEQTGEPGPSQVDVIDDDRFSEEISYLCECCPYITKDKNVFTKHVTEHRFNESGKIYYLCEHCSYLSKDANQFFKHVLEHATESQKRNELNTDILSTNKTKFVHCVNIDKLTETEKSGTAIRHTEEYNSSKLVKQTYNVDLPKYECEICSKIFKRKSNLNNHLVTHVKDFFCYVCCKSFINQARLDEHMGFHSEEELLIRKDDPAAVSCSFQKCTEKFQSTLKLFEHIKRHKNVTEYCCTTCNKKFKYLRQLKAHNKRHEETIRCTVCKKTYSSLTVLAEHMRIHSGDKPYECDVCQMKFRYRSGFISHQNVHSGCRKYKCGQCNKSFSRSNYLREHMRIHFNNKPFKCTFCEMTFTQSSVRSKHVAKKHRYCPICKILIGDFLQIKVHLWKMHPDKYDHFIGLETGKKCEDCVLKIKK